MTRNGSVMPSSMANLSKPIDLTLLLFNETSTRLCPATAKGLRLQPNILELLASIIGSARICFMANQLAGISHTIL